MQPSTAAFASKIETGARYAARVLVMWGDKVKEDTFYGGTNLGLLVESSSVNYDRLADTRSTADLTFHVKTVTGQNLLDPAAFPEVVVQVGVVTGTDYEWIDMGVFGVTDLSLSQGAGIVGVVNGVDRSGRVRDNSWRKPFQIASGTDYYAAMKLIVDDRAKGFTASYNFGSNALTTPTINHGEDQDPWAAVLKLAEAVGAEAYFDRQGTLAAFPIADPLTTPPALVIDQDSTIQITPIDKNTTNRDVYNGVICRGEAPWLLFPISGETWDEDPISPSYRYGTFGEKPKVIGDALASTDAQCLATAQAEFKKIAGVREDISFNTLKDPRIEVGDVLELVQADLQVVGRYVIDTLSYPLGKGPMSGTVRRKR